jgi:hypothetical protein
MDRLLNFSAQLIPSLIFELHTDISHLMFNRISALLVMALVLATSSSPIDLGGRCYLAQLCRPDKVIMWILEDGVVVREAGQIENIWLQPYRRGQLFVCFQRGNFLRFYQL